MTTLSKIHTFLKHYFGDAISRVLAMIYSRGCAAESDAESGSTANDSNFTDIKSCDIVADNVSDDDPDLSTEPELEPAPSIQPSPSEVIAAVVEAYMHLPSLPSILKSPEARPPLEVGVLDARQDFGPPSNVFHDRRLPFGCVTNIPGERINAVKATKVPKKIKAKKTKSKKPEPKAINFSLPTGLARGRRSGPKRARSLSVSAPGPENSASNDSPAADDQESVAMNPAPAPASAEWNSTKATLLAQVRSWSDQVKASRRHSVPIKLPLAVTVPESVPTKTDRTIKRYSAPPVLVASSKAPRLDLEELLGALIQDAKATIAALDGESGPSNSQVGLGGKEGEPEELEHKSVGDVRAFSAVALESAQDIFVIGGDSDDEDLDDVVSTGRRGSFRHDEQLPTANPSCTTSPTPGLISSISASISMAALANASSRSISDLLNAFDEVIAGQRWRRLLSRSDGISRRNDSVV
ncbi:hypothetical protein B0H11DRAFT_2035874 [Mycena galericulata]|nr:hypothetical protein B0H11DRAFT_2035874 [Mycena galericulata]